MLMAFALLERPGCLSTSCSVTQFCVVQSQGGKIAVAAEAPGPKMRPGDMARNLKAIAESDDGENLLLCMVPCPGEQVRIVQAVQWLAAERVE